MNFVSESDSIQTTAEKSNIIEAESTFNDSFSESENDSFATPEKAKSIDLSETDAVIWIGLENVPNKNELMNHFNLTDVLVSEISPYIKSIFDGKLDNFNKKRAIVNEWIKKYLPEEWQNALAERDKYTRKRSGLPANIKQIRDFADEIMEKVKYRVNVIRDKVEWDKKRVGVSPDVLKGCALKDDANIDESVDIPLEKMELRLNPKPPVRFSPDDTNNTRRRSPSPSRSRGIHQATAVVISDTVPIVVNPQEIVVAIPDDDDMSNISDLTSNLSLMSSTTGSDPSTLQPL